LGGGFMMGSRWMVVVAGVWLATGMAAQAQEPDPYGEPAGEEPPAEQPAGEEAYDEPPPEQPAGEAGYQEQQPPPQQQPAPQQQQAAQGQPTGPDGRVDGARFRGGVALTGGGEFVSSADFSAKMFGVDGRLGVQLNHLLGLYAALHLSFGSGSERGASVSTGTFATFAMADFTFLDALFAGAGIGYGVMNNPSGPALAFRVGGYPLKSAPDDRARRRGLMVSFEARTYFLGDPYGTGLQFMAAVGYEAF
ncbi:MAG: hypothetical protein ACODAG_12675, partial [Myxococcota bacterium]